MAAMCLVVNLGESYGQGSATVTKARPTFVVRGEVSNPLQLTSSDLAGMARRSMKVKDHEGKDTVYDGVLVSDILKKAGVRQGKELRGEFLSFLATPSLGRSIPKRYRGAVMSTNGV